MIAPSPTPNLMRRAVWSRARKGASAIKCIPGRHKDVTACLRGTRLLSRAVANRAGREPRATRAHSGGAQLQMRPARKPSPCLNSRSQEQDDPKAMPEFGPLGDMRTWPYWDRTRWRSGKSNIPPRSIQIRCPFHAARDMGGMICPCNDAHQGSASVPGQKTVRKP